MAYIAIVAGGHGLTWYTYASARSSPNNIGAAENAQSWKDLVCVTRELASIQDDLASRTSKKQLKATIMNGPNHDVFGNSSIHTILKDGIDGNLMIAVNTAPKAVTVQFAVSGAECKEMFQNRLINCKNGFIDNFEANEVHVYRIR
jgi:hypothetical protein